ncbi:hypothetical protein CC1G_00904 [Coprinopsis cinerea okayama7|uniref:Nudix hydrolase domain-containing protein n=1 Tax=Coprinopsis cinerea (strain Okayama-7 / 130 / ATCC MYA-4618 / FGSC 9003) TaxID=240176 RepID=A8N929_COPC7|nr:hypothetical protein CC1G_00904 [Coprinopsis cinerea okayama7\|eukprot:XP_001831357.2 hypothetical protein CC1G_00904 [Coprinopsis cinerea okayama7\
MTKASIQTVLARTRHRKWPAHTLAHSTRAHSSTSTNQAPRRQNGNKCLVFHQPLRHSTAPRFSTAESSLHQQRREIHHIFPQPQPLKFPDGYNSLLPVVLTANNLVLPPAAEFHHGYGNDPDGIYKSGIELGYHANGRPLRVASRTPLGGITAEERVVPFFISHHPAAPVTLDNDHNDLNHDRDLSSANSGGEPAAALSSAELLLHRPPLRPVGWLIPEVAAAISRDHLRHFQRDSASPWDVRYFEPGEIEGVDQVGLSESGRRQMVKSVAFADWVNEGGRHARTLHIERLLLDWKRKKVFGEVLRGWSEEPYPVFNHPAQGIEPLAFAIDKAALSIFGLPNYGALLTAYVHDPSTNETKLWIPQRSKTKKNSPGRLDVTAGGGMRLGDTPLSTILREATEEALLDIDYLNDFLKPVGTIPFLHRSSNLPSCPKLVESTTSSISKPHTYSLSEHPSNPTSPLQQQYILPGHYYLYELSLPVDMSVRPQTNLLDGEVDSFHLLPVEQVLENLVKGKFKKSSSLAIIDFLIRGGWVTEENDVFYAEVNRALRGGLGGAGSVSVPWRTAH